jgi:hypothetical protein
MRIARSLFAICTLVLAAVACNSDALPPGTQFSSLSGVIMDRTTNQPVAGALVTVDAVLTSTTDADGKFSIAQVPSGDVDYTVSAKGFAPFSGSARTEPGKPFTLNLQLDHQSPPGGAPADAAGGTRS